MVAITLLLEQRGSTRRGPSLVKVRFVEATTMTMDDFGGTWIANAVLPGSISNDAAVFSMELDNVFIPMTPIESLEAPQSGETGDERPWNGSEGVFQYRNYLPDEIGCKGSAQQVQTDCHMFFRRCGLRRLE